MPRKAKGRRAVDANGLFSEKKIKEDKIKEILLSFSKVAIERAAAELGEHFSPREKYDMLTEGCESYVMFERRFSDNKIKDDKIKEILLSFSKVAVERAAIEMYEHLSPSEGLEIAIKSCRNHAIELRSCLAPLGSFVCEHARFKMPPFSVRDVIASVCNERGMEHFDISDRFSPRMTLSEFYGEQARVYIQLKNKPGSVVFLTVDDVVAIEAVHGWKLPSAVGCLSHAMVMRNDNYMTVDAYDGESSLRQQLAPMFEMECPGCLEVLIDNVPCRIPFECGHAMCHGCAETWSKKCPTCKCDKKRGVRSLDKQDTARYNEI